MWDKITGQDRVKKIFSNIIRSNKLSHAYLFEGIDGIGKDAFAIEIAKVLNCNQPVNNSVFGIESCDICKNCLDISNFKSPLVNFVTALPTGKDENEGDENPLEKLSKEDFKNYLEAIKLKSENLYYRINLPKANFIRISSIRQLKKEASFTGMSGKRKVIIISCAEKMNPQSSNSLLKILEEPPKNTILILTTSKINSLLSTIVGRCQVINFDRIKFELIRDHILKLEPSLENEKAGFIALLSEGSITKAEDILRKDYLQMRENVISVLNDAVASKFISFEEQISKLNREKNKEKTKEFLLLTMIYFRDIMFIEAGNYELVINKDKIERIERTVKNLKVNSYKIFNLIEEAVKDINNNLFPDLVFYNLFLNIRSLIRKKIN